MDHVIYCEAAHHCYFWHRKEDVPAIAHSPGLEHVFTVGSMEGFERLVDVLVKVLQQVSIILWLMRLVLPIGKVKLVRIERHSYPRRQLCHMDGKAAELHAFIMWLII